MNIAVTLRPALSLLIGAMALYVGGASALFLAGLPSYLAFPVLVSLYLHGQSYFRRTLLLIHPQSITAFWKLEGECWQLAFGGRPPFSSGNGQPYNRSLTERAAVTFGKGSTVPTTQEPSRVAFGKQSNAFLLNTSLVTSQLMVLHFRCEEGQSHTVLVTPQSVGVASFRRLLVYLRHGRIGRVSAYREAHIQKAFFKAKASRPA